MLIGYGMLHMLRNRVGYAQNRPEATHSIIIVMIQHLKKKKSSVIIMVS
jgi:hypothetical protein